VNASTDLSNIAVVTFAQNKEAKRLLRTAQTRLENILLDNGVTVLDQKKAEEMKDVWKQLEDPGYFITAEEFVENSEKYAIDGILRVYLTAESTKTVGGYYSATALADVRLVGADAKVSSHTTIPMGIPGRPPSDGLTQASALSNAVQRSIDEASAKVGLEILDYTNPRLLKFKLEGPTRASLDKPLDFDRRTSARAKQIANLKNTSWEKESVTCQDTDASGNFSVIGGYVFKNKYGRFNYWSELHLVDVKNNKEVLTHGPLTKERRERGSSKVTDCMFVKNWRYILALTEHEVFMWDTERNVVVSSSKLGKRVKNGKLAYIAGEKNNDIIAITNRKDLIAFNLVRE
jgi:hypothetical protein